VFEYGIIS